MSYPDPDWTPYRQAHDLTARENYEAIIAGEDLAYGGVIGRWPLHLGACDHCGYFTTLHDIVVDMGPGRLESVVGQHCGACCDRGRCDDRVRVVYMTEVSVKRARTESATPMYARSECLACRGGVECVRDHGCKHCGLTKDGHYSDSKARYSLTCRDRKAAYEPT